MNYNSLSFQFHHLSSSGSCAPEILGDGFADAGDGLKLLEDIFHDGSLLVYFHNATTFFAVQPLKKLDDKRSEGRIQKELVRVKCCMPLWHFATVSQCIAALREIRHYFFRYVRLIKGLA